MSAILFVTNEWKLAGDKEFLRISVGISRFEGIFISVCVCVRPIEANKAERKESEGRSDIKYK